MCLQTDVRNKLISLYSRPCSFTKQIAASLTSILQPDAQHQGALALLPLPFLRHQFPLYQKYCITKNIDSQKTFYDLMLNISIFEYKTT